MKRLLCIVGKMDVGGAETFLMKLYRHIDRNRFQMDFCVADSQIGYYEPEILDLGGRIFRIIPKTKGIIKSFFSLKKIVKDNNYQYVMRISQHSLSGLELIAAKMGGAKNLIFRSSNTHTCGGKFNQLLHKVALPLTMFVPTLKVAPSTEAAKFMFGKKITNVHIFPNALDTSKFLFNLKTRNRYRNKLNLTNKLVVGHIGRFSKQKNHIFLIKVFKELIKVKKNAILLLVGKGNEKILIKKLVKDYNLENNVIFIEYTSEVQKLLFVMDIFIFPSFYEGMPNTVIEAQSTGLPCLIADTITPEVKIIDKLVKFEALEKEPIIWVRDIIELLNNNKYFNREIASEIIKKKGYDISSVVKDFENIVFK